MNGAMQLAQMMATSKLVPAHLQKSPGDCLLVIEQAMRWNMSPFAVAQCTSVIQGRLMFEGKLVSAAVQTCGILAGRLKFAFTGEGNTRSIIVTGEIKGEIGDPREITVRLADAKTTNGMWVKQPDQQLVYFATRAWARRHTPEVMLGVYSPEEFPAADIPARDTFRGTTLDADEAALTPAAQAAAATAAYGPPADVMPSRQDRKAAIEQPRPKRTTVSEWLDALGIELANASPAEADEILARSDVQKAQDTLRGDAKDRLQYILDQTIARLAAADEAAETQAGDELFADPSSDPFRAPVTA
jgi:hypothetical protein